MDLDNAILDYTLLKNQCDGFAKMARERDDEVSALYFVQRAAIYAEFISRLEIIQVGLR